MSTITQISNERTNLAWVKWFVVTLVIAILAFLLSPMAPYGTFWRPAAGAVRPQGIQLTLFMILNIAEVLTFGLGISFLIFGYSIVERVLPQSKGLATAAYFSIAWSLMNWWPHDSLHIHVGEANLGGLLAIEYGFHITLMVAGAILAYFFFALVRQRSNMQQEDRKTM